MHPLVYLLFPHFFGDVHCCFACVQRVIGQEEAVSAVANAIRNHRAGLSEEKKPIGAFLFLGSSGELALNLTFFMPVSVPGGGLRIGDVFGILNSRYIL